MLESSLAEVVNDSRRTGPTILVDLLLEKAAVLAAYGFEEVAETTTVRPAPTQQPGSPKPAPPATRKSGLDYRESDRLLALEMREMIDSGTATNPYNAALALCEKAKGAAKPDSRKKRLLIAYKREFPCDQR